jgi:hypothetical protein
MPNGKPHLDGHLSVGARRVIVTGYYTLSLCTLPSLSQSNYRRGSGCSADRISAVPLCLPALGSAWSSLPLSNGLPSGCVTLPRSR